MTQRKDSQEGVATTLSSRRRAPEGRVGQFLLEVVDGPDRGATLLVLADAPGPLLIGQSPICALRLTDREVSRRHLGVQVRGVQLHVKDLDSTNGTYANGVSVREADLEGEVELRLGSTIVRVRTGIAESPALPNAIRFGSAIGGSAAMRRLYPLCERLAQAKIPLLIEGETGTGKEVLAESIHERSERADGPFVVIDCTAIPPNLAESTLFGHERGAFTGALAARRGVFEQAHGGTLFVDEVGDLEMSLQPKLLRAIERGEIQRVGSEQWTRVDVRVLSATRRNLDLHVEQGRFRDDLFFRMAVARIELPPLRERDGDVGLLARHFWRQLGGAGELPPEFSRGLEDYPFPGNVRELHNMVARRIALGELDVPSAHTPSSDINAPAGQDTSSDFIGEVLAADLPLVSSRQRVVDEFERRYTERMLERYSGDSKLAAAAAGVARRYFQLVRARHNNR